jgi:hypothetical protein
MTEINNKQRRGIKKYLGRVRKMVFFEKYTTLPVSEKFKYFLTYYLGHLFGGFLVSLPLTVAFGGSFLKSLTLSEIFISIIVLITIPHHQRETGKMFLNNGIEKTYRDGAEWIIQDSNGIYFTSCDTIPTDNLENFILCEDNVEVVGLPINTIGSIGELLLGSFSHLTG